jgi:alkanesulfonate monooxygenase SsuD/methylene tetrahydromethanopterin reductase-like flavin-dependent oxidoreductase (luciferase family)
MSIAGTPARVADYLAGQAAAADANFFLAQMVFGDMTYEDALRSLTLFAREVRPALAAASVRGVAS